MPANGTITLTDEGAVDLVLTPTGINGYVSNYKDLSEAAEVGRATLAIKMEEKPNLRKVTVTLRVPRLVTEVINSVNHYSAPDFVMVKVEAFVPHTWAEADIDQVREWASDLIEDSIVESVIDDGAFPY